MTDVVLFHHVLGLTPGVTAFADRLRAAGHRVHTPDLFQGRTFTSIDEGIAFAQSTGFDVLVERAVQAFASLPQDSVVAGFSMGVMAAQEVLQTTPTVRGALLLHGFCEPSQLPGAWPATVPVQVHGAEHDPYFVDDGDLAAAQAWQAQHPNLEILLYPGSAHLFTDSSTAEYDEQATATLLERVLSFLAHLS